MISPLVTIVITSYNHEHFVRESISSVMNQSYPNMQIIVVDDASTDNTKKKIIQLLEENPNKFQIEVNKENSGSSFSRNVGLLQAKGKYVCFLDADDLYLPNKIATQVNVMEEKTGFTFSYHDSLVFDTNNEKNNFLSSKRYGSGGGNAADLIEKGMFITFGSIMYKRENLKNIFFNEIIFRSEDWVFTIDSLFASSNKFIYINDPLMKYRRHSNNKTLSWEKKLQGNLNNLNIINSKYEDLESPVRKRKADLYFMLFFFLFLNGKFRESFPNLLKYLNYSFPNIFRCLKVLFRESNFLIKNNFQLDPLLTSMILKEEN